MDNRWVSRDFINYTSFGATVNMIFYSGYTSSGNVVIYSNGQYHINWKFWKFVEPTGVES